MIRWTMFALVCAAGITATFSASRADAQQAYGGTQAYGKQWSGSYSTQDWNRFYHYPYVYYPQNYYGDDYYRSSESLYYRYPQEMRIPVYNKQWHNPYPEGRIWHSGHHFILDTF